MKILMAEHTHYDSASQVGCHHLAQGFARRGHEVTYLSTALTPFHISRFFGHQKSDTARRFKNWASGGRQWEKGLFSYVPLTPLPYVRMFFLDRPWVPGSQLRLTVPGLVKKLRARGPFDALLVGEPRFIPLLRAIGAPVNILRLTDDIMGFQSTPRSLEGLMRESAPLFDRVIATSAPLREKLSRTLRRDDVIYMPNGVEYDHFARPDKDEPADLARLPAPRALYVGAIREWFDWDWMAYCAKTLPRVSFVLIGPSDSDPTERSRGLPNVHYLGPRPYAQVPHYMAFSQVGIIPFRREERTDSVSSIKLLQYLAAGLPTVSSRWKELEGLGAPVWLADDREGFAAAIAEALEKGADREVLRNFARGHSWEGNVDRILGWLERRMDHG